MMHECITFRKRTPQNAGMHSKEAADNARGMIRAFMERRGYTSERSLALDAHVDQSTLHRFLSEDTEQLSVPNLLKLATFMNTSVSALLGDEPEVRYSLVDVDDESPIRRTLKVMEDLPPHLQQAVADLASNLAKKP